MKVKNNFSVFALILVLFLSSTNYADVTNVCNLNGFVTFTQGGWGATAHGNNAGVIRDAWFSTVFPTGMVIGTGKTLTFTTSAAVNAFLPAGGTSAAFNTNYVNPTSTSAGVLAGQLAALTLNVKFDEAGKIGTNNSNLGDLVFVSGPFEGMSVNEFLVLAYKAIGGQGLSGYTFSDFNDAATSVNENFVDGKTNNGALTCGDTPASIGDFVWLDANKNGVQDAGESGINGVTVKLFTCSGTLIATTTTDATGFYAFPGVAAADYYLEFTVPAGYTITLKNATADDKDSDINPDGKTDCFTFAATADDITFDAGLYPANASVGDKVWNDLDKDGIQDDNELGIPGITVELFDCNNTLVASTTTNSAGLYLFTDLNAGSYYVKFTIPDGYTVSPQNVGDDSKDSDIGTDGKTACLTLSAGENNMTLDAGLFVTPASVGDRVWLDTNKDGIQDAGEYGISNVEVKLYDCNGNYITKKFTDGNGNYLFTNLTPGEYYISMSIPAGYSVSPQNAGTDDEVDSDIDQTTGRTVCFYLEAAGNDLTRDAGMYLTPARLGDFVWNDTNKDGIQDFGESGIQGVVVELWNCNTNAKITETTTDANGFYLFDDLSAGSYKVKFILPTDYSFSPKDAGTDESLDSDADLVTGFTACVTLAQGETNVTLDAGMYLTLASADLRLEKTSSVTNPDDNEQVTFTVTVYNDGTSTATGVKVSDLLPLGLVYNSCTASQGTYDETTGLWDIGTIPNGGSVVLTVVATTSLAALNNTTIDLGPATGWNAFILEDLNQPSSDTEGKLAVGRNATLAGYSVGDKLPNSNGTVDVLVVGNNLTYTSGRVYNGNVVYGNSSNLPTSSVSVEEGAVRKDNVINFADATTHLTTLSAQLANYTATAGTRFEWNELHLTGADPYLNVFNVNGAELSAANTVNINVPNGSAVLVNISGTTVSWTGGLFVLGTSISNVIYNFPQATNITMHGIEIRGSILAPFAHIDFSTGLVSGQMIAKSLTGMVQMNNHLFSGNIPGNRTITNIAQITAADQYDPDSTPGNNVTTEDDYDAASISIEFNTSGTPSGNWQYAGELLPDEIISCITSDESGNLVAGTHWGKVYVSAGANLTSWTNINAGNTFGTVWSIAARTAGIFVATSDGLFKTTNNGTTWTASGFADQDVRSIVIHGTTLYAGVWGGGVYKSIDGGTTWTSINSGINNTAIGALTISATGDLYAATFGDGLFKSTNGGTTWTNINVGFPYVWSVGLTSDGTIFAGTYGSGVFVSRDGGATFESMLVGLNNAFIYAITVDLANNVYINSWSGGVYVLPAGTLTWSNMGMSGYGVSSIFINPTNTESNGVVYVGTSDGRIFKNVDGVSSTEDDASLPKEFSLAQNYPNPFNPSTTIEFSLTETEMVKLEVFNILGEQVRTLINSEMKAGKHRIDFNGNDLNTGVYFYRINTPSHSVTKKMLLIK